VAGAIAAFFSVLASLFRIYGGYLSDRYDACCVMYWTLGISVAVSFILCYPPTRYIVETTLGLRQFYLATGPVLFTVLVFALGFAMALGKAPIYKHLPVYHPENVGAIGGLVGMIGAVSAASSCRSSSAGCLI